MQISDYPLETHYVETEDGYILTLFRFMVNPAVTTSTFANNNINHGVEENENEKKLSDNISRPPVLLVLHIIITTFIAVEIVSIQ